MDVFVSMDDLDLAEMTSPPRNVHRRMRSDPTDFMRSLRADRFPAGSSAKRDHSPQPTGVSPVVKRHASETSRPPSSASSDDSDDCGRQQAPSWCAKWRPTPGQR